jgi:prepilin-type N-terminal cleavage/methylation domain-containing protein
MKQNEMGPDVRCSERGVTLLELMIVVVIATVLAALAAPSFAEWQKDLTCREVTRHIASTLRYAKSRAISTNLEHRVEYEPENRRYRLTQGDKSGNSSHWNTIVYDWIVLPPGVHIDTNVNAIHLNTNGTASGGTISIQDGTKKTKFKVIVVSTGRIRIPAMI